MSAPVLHRRVLTRWAMERRGRRAGLAAIAAALLGAGVGAGPWVHLGLLAGAAAAAAAWPVRDDERRALRWVGDRTGLAYETAWEHPAAPDGGAPGVAGIGAALRAAVAVEGRLSIRDVTPPPVAAWWLPMGVTALGIWLWAALAAGPGGGWTPPFSAAPSSPSPTGPAVPGGEDDTVDPLAEEAIEVEAPDPRAEARPADAASAPAGGDGGAGAGDGAPSERDVLERFLDRIRERSPEEAPARVVPAEIGVDPDEDAARREGEGEAGDAAAGERPEGATGDDDGDGDGDRDEEGAGEGAADPGDTGAEGAAPDPDAPPGDDGGADGTRPDGDAGVGATGLDEGGDEGTAGMGIGAAGEAGAGTDPAAGESEPLPSILGPGPESPVGGVTMEGVAPIDPFPPGAAGLVFRRAVEEALGEGDLPAPYQEIIRNYFR